MNAPTTIKPQDWQRSSGTHEELTLVRGIARHVSVDGCQFVVTQGSVHVGQRLSFATGADLVIAGSVRWILGDRIAFGYDRQIASGMMPALLAQLGGATVVDLRPCPAANDVQGPRA